MICLKRMGNEFVRTFASYQNEDDIGYGDTNVYPLSVFTKSSQNASEKHGKRCLGDKYPKTLDLKNRGYLW